MAGASSTTDGELVDGHSRLLRRRIGRVVVGVVLVVLAVWIVGPNMPASPVRENVEAVWKPAEEIGLVQDWTVFSPNPRNQSIDLRAELEYSDGTTAQWDVPEFDPLIGAYRQYRWNKWQERVRLDARMDLWDPTAEWIARTHVRDGELPRVTLVRRWIDHGALTNDGHEDSDWNDFVFHTWIPEDHPDVTATVEGS